MAEDEQKHKGRLAAAVLAGSALTFSSFAIGVPAAFADATDESPVEASATPEPEDHDASSQDTGSEPEEGESTPEATGDDDPEDEPSADETDLEEPNEENTPEVESLSPQDTDGATNVEQTLTADRQQINLEDFINDPDSEENQGVNFTAEGFEPSSTIAYEVVSPGNVEGTEGTAWADEQGTAQFYIFGYDWVSNPEVYLGEYSVTVTYETEDGETLEAGPVNFTVVSEGGDDPEDPGAVAEISLDATEGQPGDSVNVSGVNFVAEEQVELFLEDQSGAAEDVLLVTANTNEDGELNESVIIPEDTPQGEYNIVAMDTSGAQTAVPFTVTTADEGEELEPTLYLSPAAGAAGTIISLSGSDFTENGDVSLSMTPVDGDDTIELEPVTANDSGSISEAEATIPEDAANGVYTITALDVETGATVDADFNVTDSTLEIDPATIDLAEFREGGSGVTHTVDGLEPGTEVEFHVGTSVSPTDLGGTAVADENGIAEYTVNAPADNTYVGNYSTTVIRTADDVQVATGNFAVTSDQPQIWLPEDEVYQGESLQVHFSNLTPEGEITVDWNPTETMTAGIDGYLDAELAIADDADTGVQELTVTDETTGASNTVEYTVLESGDAVTEPALNIDPEEITVDDFVGEPDDGAGVAHTVEGIEAGAEISYVVSGPEGVNDFERTTNADDEGLVEFVIAGYDVSNPNVYLGDYTTVVTYEDENGESAELSGDFSVVTETGATPGDEDTPGESDGTGDPVDTSDPVDLNGTDLATTGTSNAQLGWIAGGLLALGTALFSYANRGRLFGRKN